MYILYMRVRFIYRREPFFSYLVLRIFDGVVGNRADMSAIQLYASLQKKQIKGLKINPKYVLDKRVCVAFPKRRSRS